MVGDIIRNDNDLHIGIGFHHQVLDELNETVTVFVRFGLVPNRIIAPIVGSKGTAVTW